MKYITAVCLVLLLSCGKEILPTQDSIELTISDDALAPLPCHASSFVTNYPIVAGKVPPFTMTKTLYADGRVNTIKMITRALPNTASGQQQYYEWNYKITYSPNQATMVGTRKLYGYSGSTRFLIYNLNSTFYFSFNSAGYCYEIYRPYGISYQYSVSLEYLNNTTLKKLTTYDWTEDNNDEYRVFNITTDTKGNINRVKSSSSTREVKYVYNLGSTGKNYFYQPTQYAINQWYGFLEAMQWIPMPKSARTSVALNIPTASTPIIQSQKYLNHKYDVKGNLISYTYSDNILQKVTWVCK